LRRAAKGFSVEEQVSSASEAKSSGAPVDPELKDIFNAAVKETEDRRDQPFVNLAGPLKPPAAPATYKALTKIRLRVSASRFADLVTSTEIPKGAVFRAVASKEDTEDGGIVYLRTDGEYENGWFMEKAIIGEFKGKPVVKRVAGSTKASGAAMLSMSEVTRAEVMGIRKPGAEQVKQEVAAEMADDTPQSRQKQLQAMLNDPEVRAMVEKSGVSLEALKQNPEFMRAISRRLFGDEVVG